MPSHRGNPGSSSATNSHRISLISLLQEKEKASSEKENKVNISNMNKIHNENKGNQQQHQRGARGRRGTNKKKTVDQVHRIGIGNEDATPQELYAIGAVFDHIYRGGSPRKCMSVFKKEVSRAPPAKIFGCVGFRWNAEEEEADDDHTLQTMDWTYNRSFLGDDDLYTIDENGSYARSFMSRDDTLQSSLDEERARVIRFANDRDKPDQPWDEGTVSPINRKKGSKTAKFRKQRLEFDADTRLWSDLSGITISGGKDKRGTIKSPKRTTKNSNRSNPDLDEGELSIDDVFSEADETIERFKSLSEILASSARENEENESHSPDPTLNCSMKDLTPLVRLFRNTVSGGISEDTKSSTTALKINLDRIFNTNCARNNKGDDVDDDFYRSDESTFITPSSQKPKPLNSLAMTMQSIAYKQPTGIYAASEQDQVAGKKRSTLSEQRRTKQKPTNVSSTPTTSPSSVGAATIAFDDIPVARGQNGDSTVVVAPLSKQFATVTGVSTTASLSGISRADTEGVGSHRGDAITPVSTSPRQKIPSSIRMPPSHSHSHSVLQDLFISPSRVSSSAASIPHRQSFFRRRESYNVDSRDGYYYSENANKAPNALAKAASSSSPRRNLPPVPPTRSPTTPSTASSPTRNLHLSSDNDGTELSIIGFPEEHGTDSNSVITPPQQLVSSSSGISMKKRFSFRKRKTDVVSRKNSTANDVAANADSPRSTMGVNTKLFLSSSASYNENTGAYCYDSAIGHVADDATNMDENEIDVVLAPTFDEDEISTTNGLLLTQKNIAPSEYEVQSV